ncbi:hypothetical protein NW754_001423 [Fusarium falciforme]|nr:hypothetical protein NW754_001423 [Fusarium falciforme]
MSKSSVLDVLRVAVVQHEPEWMGLQGSVNKACSIIAEAAQNGAKLVAFPEAFIPGYPAWLASQPMNAKMQADYIKNSLVVDSEEMAKIQACAARNHIVVSLGYSENDHNSLFIGQAIIDLDGKILVRRRKIKATHLERAIFGDASGDSLLNVAATGIGRRVGTLACWEHCQPLLKYHTATYREEIHCAAWPPLFPHAGPELYSLAQEGALVLSQAYAIETQTFTLHSSTVLTEKGIEKLGSKGGLLMSKPGGGTSAVIRPDGKIISTPLDPTAKGLVYADLNMDQGILARSYLDICGHYSRPDLLWLGCDTRVRKHKVDANRSGSGHGPESWATVTAGSGNKLQDETDVS